jgi:phosphinothricin acetyltransferase
MDLVIDGLNPDDWPAVRAIYLEGIATGQATFETEAPSWQDWDAAHLPHCRLAARLGGAVAGWGALSPVSRRRCYAGVAEVSVYVAAAHRGRQLGKRLLQALIAESERRGIWTLQGATFPENTASLRLQESCGFRIVGRRERIGQLHGVWRSTIVTERRSRTVGIDTEPARSDPLEIRPYQDADERSVIALWNEVLPATALHNDPATSIRKKVAADRDLFLVAAVDGSVVGTVMGGWDGHRGWIYSMAVAPRYQRRGIATALMRRLESALAERGCLKINLQVRQSNAGVVAFYQKLGYVPEQILSMGKRLY